MLIGDAEVWVDRFRGFDDRFMDRIAALWPVCVEMLGPQPTEDTITINLVDRLCVDPVVRRLCHYVAYQQEPFGLAPDGTKYSKGKIDIAVLFDWERERYLAYECKRLNVIGTNGRSSLASAYVAEGMMRFITEQYAQDLPLGCMLGYVMDGDTAFARQQLTMAIVNHGPLALFDGPTSTPSVGAHPRFETRHARLGGRDINLRHTLLIYA
ncbi:MAG: hypothetical protein JF625_04745 [Inquilinus limosus]|uniref:Restriction endonuclease n=1 Tax=Inquilinus limosus TaxID=171674 RepID=A0A952FGI3_9PROT|nr:hypothetical protein [Inquilinus limosus]